MSREFPFSTISFLLISFIDRKVSKNNPDINKPRASQIGIPNDKRTGILGPEQTKEGKGGWLRQCSPFSQEYGASNLRTLFPVGGRKLRKAVSKGGRQDK